MSIIVCLGEILAVEGSSSNHSLGHYKFIVESHYKYILLYVSKPFFYQSIAGTATSHDAADCGGLVSRSGKSGQTTDAWVKIGPPWCLESPRSFARRRLAL